MEQEWITKSEVLKCGKYRKISTHMPGFKEWVENGYLTPKMGRGINGKTATFFNTIELDDLMAKIEAMENNYFAEKEVAKTAWI
ncbi:hypothetical protein ACT7DN_01780 [Bacillus paranthracis]